MKMNPVVHFEMPAKDRKRISSFYSKVFGWKTQQMGEDMGNYVLATTTEVDEKTRMPKNPGAINGGFFENNGESPIEHPSIVISVDDIKAHMGIVKDAGGKTFGEPMEIPGVGLFVVFEDTEGNKHSMLQPAKM